jgi:hypothetical protein
MFKLVMQSNGKESLINLANVTCFMEIDALSTKDGITPVIQHRVNFIDGSDFEITKESYDHTVSTVLEIQMANAGWKTQILNSLIQIEHCLSNAAVRLEEIRDNVGYFLANKS